MFFKSLMYFFYGKMRFLLTVILTFLHNVNNYNQCDDAFSRKKKKRLNCFYVKYARKIYPKLK